MTYRELIELLEELEDDQQNQEVMAQVDDEYYRVIEVLVKEKDDRLKDGHPYFMVE